MTTLTPRVTESAVLVFPSQKRISDLPEVGKDQERSYPYHPLVESEFDTPLLKLLVPLNRV
jgi:hypothetical protein